LHSITKILRNGPRAHFPFSMYLSFQNYSILNRGIVMTEVYCSISKTLVFKNFVSKHD
jgi:hypothetical protein